MCTLHLCEVTFFKCKGYHVQFCVCVWPFVTWCHRCLVPHHSGIAVRSPRGNICLFWNNDSNHPMYNYTPRKKLSIIQYSCITLLMCSFSVWQQRRRLKYTVKQSWWLCVTDDITDSDLIIQDFVWTRPSNLYFYLNKSNNIFWLTLVVLRSFPNTTKHSKCSCLSKRLHPQTYSCCH